MGDRNYNFGLSWRPQYNSVSKQPVRRYFFPFISLARFSVFEGHCCGSLQSACSPMPHRFLSSFCCPFLSSFSPSLPPSPSSLTTIIHGVVLNTKLADLAAPLKRYATAGMQEVYYQAFLSFPTVNFRVIASSSAVDRVRVCEFRFANLQHSKLFLRVYFVQLGGNHTLTEELVLQFLNLGFFFFFLLLCVVLQFLMCFAGDGGGNGVFKNLRGVDVTLEFAGEFLNPLGNGLRL